MPAQSPLDALDILIKKFDVQPHDIEKISITLPEGRYGISNNTLMPNMCLQHLTSLFLIDRKLNFTNTHDESRMDNLDILDLRKKIELIPSKELRAATPPRQGIVEILTLDGQKLRHHTKAVHGSAANPMNRQDVAAKAEGLMTPILGLDKTKALVAFIWGLERVTDISVIRSMLQA